MKSEYLKLPFAQHATAQFKHSLIRNPPLSLVIFRRFGSIAALVKIYHRMRFGTAPEVYRRIAHSRIAELNRLYRRLHIAVTRPKTAKRVVKRIIGVNIAGNACCDAPQTQAQSLKCGCQYIGTHFSQYFRRAMLRLHYL